MKRSHNGLAVGVEVVVLRDIYRVPNSLAARADWYGRIPDGVVQGGMEHKWEAGHPAWEAYLAAAEDAKSDLLKAREHQLYAKAGERGILIKFFSNYQQKPYGHGVQVRIGNEIKTFRWTSIMSVSLYREKFGELPVVIGE